MERLLSPGTNRTSLCGASQLPSLQHLHRTDIQHTFLGQPKGWGRVIASHQLYLLLLYHLHPLPIQGENDWRLSQLPPKGAVRCPLTSLGAGSDSEKEIECY